MTTRNAIIDFARLDQVGTQIVPRLKYAYAQEFRDAVLRFGSISKMPEPFKSWCENPDSIDSEFLESE
jgi:hypothetical protein